MQVRTPLTGCGCGKQVCLCRRPWGWRRLTVWIQRGGPGSSRRLRIGVWVGARCSWGLGIGIYNRSWSSWRLGIRVLRCWPRYGSRLGKSPRGMGERFIHCWMRGEGRLAIGITGLVMRKAIYRSWCQCRPFIRVDGQSPWCLGHWPVRILGGRRGLHRSFKRAGTTIERSRCQQGSSIRVRDPLSLKHICPRWFGEVVTGARERSL